MSKYRAVFLDLSPLDQGDLDLAPLQSAFAELTCHTQTSETQIVDRLLGAEVAIVNKVALSDATLAACPDLKLILVAATGVNNIDLAAAKQRGIAVCNCQAYGTATVAQHTLMLLLALATRLPDYQAAVARGRWQESGQFCLLDFPIIELAGKTLGVLGHGELGGAVGKLAEALGMRVLVGNLPGRPPRPDRLELDELLPQIDALTLHCPLTEQTRNLIGARELQLMKPTAFIINTARGGLIDEQALADTLRSGHLGGAATDVLISEPPSNDNPLLAADVPRLIVTPHSAWGSREARQRIVGQLRENAEAFFAGTPKRQVG
ncbi:glycerate dehydrogenase [Pseudomonas sp. Choline-3u-10]|jgi:glycerate dehydrogenase|uniref:2-hydroxyacid dehydrogenase n=1 Tax=Pseudomonadaceae TaxID=135621 RepID=UPI000617AAE9|nr:MULTISPECIES: 2-hydroxyacid dehydrogenase [Pseudomonadaceae]MAL36243.1 glycerate dehydrogenase [Pseudomonas sp.]MBU0947757.1 2-hydroxyacid dehydrogenase [Gammaproteobacteria bacterium]KJJ63265.1 glycerate dehydrogenase [Pseudomonas sp. 10B238]MBK3796308.1 2-hydroxyacid dehydrogenase [Stutzerimonas stutzeri]MBK3876811.1 2-hydroxyacid dehydrogenase [Stutzerimonas stutzeri]|tara:strand:- start:317 stop:1279 length:963 start_codon:yes stop_codon:yes gene_type:complete